MHAYVGPFTRIRGSLYTCGRIARVLRLLPLKRVRFFILMIFFIITCGRIARVLRLLLLKRLHRTLCLCSSCCLTLQNGAARALKQLTEVVEQPEESA